MQLIVWNKVLLFYLFALIKCLLIHCVHCFKILEYERFSKRRLSGTQTFSKAVTFKAYEHLIALELFRCTETFSQSSLTKEYKPMCMLIETSQIKEAFQKYPACPTELLSWCDSMFAWRNGKPDIIAAFL